MKRKMIFFSYSAIPSFTANSIAVMNFCQELNKIYDLTVVCIKNKDIPTNYKNFYNVNKLNLILLPKIFLKANYIFYKLYAILLCLKKRPNIIFSRDIIISYTLSKFGFDNIFEIHQIKQNGNNYYTKNFERLLYKMKDFKRLKYIVAISESLKKECIEFGVSQQKLFVANSGVRNDFFNCDLGENRNILYLGSLQRGKGIENIFSLAQELNDFNFLIIGGKNNELPEIKNNMIHLGWIEPSKVLDNVKDIDYALMLFDYQNYKFHSPLKLFEYMAMGKIIIASNIEGINDIIINNYNGILVNPQNVEEISSVIRKLDKNQKLKEKLSFNAKETARKYTWEERASKIKELENR